MLVIYAEKSSLAKTIAAVFHAGQRPPTSAYLFRKKSTDFFIKKSLHSRVRTARIQYFYQYSHVTNFFFKIPIMIFSPLTTMPIKIIPAIAFV